MKAYARAIGAVLILALIAGCGQESTPVTFTKSVKATEEVPVGFKLPKGWEQTDPGEITDETHEFSFSADDVVVGTKDDAQDWLRDYAYSGDEVEFDDFDDAKADAFTATWRGESDDEGKGREIREYYYKHTYKGDEIWVAAMVARGAEDGADMDRSIADQIAATVRIDGKLAKSAIADGVESFEEDDSLT